MTNDRNVPYESGSSSREIYATRGLMQLEGSDSGGDSIEMDNYLHKRAESRN